MMSRPVIEARGLSFGFGDGRRVLEDVSFHVDEKEYFSIIGPNGAGKSTLLKLVAGILTGASGGILIKGEPAESYSRKNLAKIIGYVPQQGGQVFPYTAYDFIMMGRYPHLSPFTSIGEDDREAAREAMALTGIEAFAGRFIKSLSGGERQKVFISAALAQGAEVLLLDEPTTFLDPKSEDEILNTLVKINRERGVTIVSVTHEINSAAIVSDRVMAIKEGRKVFTGVPIDLMKNDVLREIYDKDFMFVDHPTAGRPVVIPRLEAR